MHLCSITEGTVHVHLPGKKKIHPVVPAAVPAALSSRWELTACDTFSMLSGKCYLVTHPLLPSLPLGPTPRGHGYLIPQAMWWPLASSIHWSLRLLYLLGILLTMPVVLLFTLFAEPRVGKIKENFQQAGKLEENSRNCRNCMFILSTLVRGPMQQICYILLWLTQQTQP